MTSYNVHSEARPICHKDVIGLPALMLCSCAARFERNGKVIENGHYWLAGDVFARLFKEGIASVAQNVWHGKC